MGDIDLNSELGITDVTALAKFVANAELYPLANSTSAANADLNGNKIINSADTSILVEYMLGNSDVINIK